MIVRLPPNNLSFISFWPFRRILRPLGVSESISQINVLREGGQDVCEKRLSKLHPWWQHDLIYSTTLDCTGLMKLLRVYRLINCHWCRRSHWKWSSRVPCASVYFSTFGYICHLNFIACACEYMRALVQIDNFQIPVFHNSFVS